MYTYKRLMICLDQSEADNALIAAAKHFVDADETEQIYFFHVVKSLELPPKVHEQYQELVTPIDESIEDDLRVKITDVFQDTKVALDIDVREGNTTDQILKWSNNKEVDLIMMGKKPLDKGSGLNADKILNTAHCSVIFIPEQCLNIQTSRILVPTDFSPASHCAFEKAVTIAKLANASITCFHAFEVPTGYHTTGKTYEEFAEIMLGHAKNHFAEFMEEEVTNGVDINCLYELDKHGKPYELVLDAAKKINADFIVIGSKGRTSLSSVLLGSIAAKVIRHEFNIPVLVVKARHENLSLLKAILQL